MGHDGCKLGNQLTGARTELKDFVDSWLAFEPINIVDFHRSSHPLGQFGDVDQFSSDRFALPEHGRECLDSNPTVPDAH